MCNLSEAIVEETTISLIKKLLKEGKTPKEIHDFCGYPLELIQEVQEESDLDGDKTQEGFKDAIRNLEMQIQIVYDMEAKVWVGVCSKIGLALESNSIEKLLQRIAVAVPELMNLNGMLSSEIALSLGESNWDSFMKAVDMFSPDFMKDGRSEQIQGMGERTAYAANLESKGHESGIEEGKRIERNELLAVVEFLQKEGRNNEISRAISNPAYRENLLAEESLKQSIEGEYRIGDIQLDIEPSSEYKEYVEKEKQRLLTEEDKIIFRKPYKVKDTKQMNEINQKAFSALKETLGAMDTIRFLEQFDGGGHGDYTAEKYSAGTPFDNMTEEDLRKMFGL